MRGLRPFFTQTAKGRQSLVSGGGILILAGILLLLNLLSQALFARWDWTADNRYSLSPASVRLVRSLPDPVLVRFYLTPGLPQPYQSQGRYIRDLLNEYRAAAKGKVRVELLDPEESEARKSEALSAGVSPVRFTQVASDQFQVREGYAGLVLFYQDKQTVIPFVKDTGSLEYDLSSRIKQMAAPEKKTLAFVTGHGEAPADALRGTFVPVLFDRFDARSVRLSTAAEADPDALFIVGPRSQYTDEDIRLLDGYVARGVPVAVFVNRRIVNMGSFSSVAQVTGLEPFLEHYGVRVERDFVLDAQCQRISLQSQQGPYAVTNILNYPAIPLSNRLNNEHLLTKSLDVLSFPFAHPLSPSTTGQTDLRVTTLAESSAYSWITPNLAFLDPYTLRAPADTDPKGPFPLAVLVEGSTRSYSDPAKAVSGLRLVVVGSSFFADPQMPLSEGNGLFFVALAEWLSQDPNLLAIPPKGAPFRPIRPLSPFGRAAVKALGYFFLPVLVVAGAAARWQLRRRKRLQVERDYQTATPVS